MSNKGANKALTSYQLITPHIIYIASPNSLALFATDSLELKLAYTAINEHKTHINAYYSGIKMVFLSNERRTIILLEFTWFSNINILKNIQ